jgi:hypothetical protein
MAGNDLKPCRERSLIIQPIKALPSLDENILNQVIRRCIVEMKLPYNRTDEHFIVLIKSTEIQSEGWFVSQSLHGDPRMIQ